MLAVLPLAALLGRPKPTADQHAIASASLVRQQEALAPAYIWTAVERAMPRHQRYLERGMKGAAQCGSKVCIDPIHCYGGNGKRQATATSIRESTRERLRHLRGGAVASRPTVMSRRTALCATVAHSTAAMFWPLASSADGIGPPSTPRALAAVAGGFLIPPAQFASYADALSAIGCSTILHEDVSTLTRPTALVDGGRSILQEVEARATAEALPSTAPLILLGHSRGAKLCVSAASQSKRRRVAALVLLDPVDATEPDPDSVLADLAALSPTVPVAILGTGKSGYDCAPLGSNYKGFAEACRGPCLVGTLPSAGHTQFVDNRRALTVDVCTSGKVADAAVREVAVATTKEWASAALDALVRPGGADSAGTAALQRAIRELRQQTFATSVEWQVDGL